jgi:ACS family allantoate permease-like MFS transporter
MILSNVPCLVGSFLIYYEPTTHKLTRLAGIYILMTNTVSYIMVMSMISSNFAGMTRKTTVAAGLFLSYSAGNLVAPQLFLTREAPRYPTGFKGMIAAFILMIVVEILLMLWLIWENKRRDKKFGTVGQGEDADTDFLDLTDKEQPNFRYVW